MGVASAGVADDILLQTVTGWAWYIHQWSSKSLGTVWNTARNHARRQQLVDNSATLSVLGRFVTTPPW